MKTKTDLKILMRDCRRIAKRTHLTKEKSEQILEDVRQGKVDPQITEFVDRINSLLFKSPKITKKEFERGLREAVSIYEKKPIKRKYNGKWVKDKKAYN